ncbi:hypothetical protein P7C71_g3344, partial [Lecanoromycetidae sp. Uapishka_2]
MGLFEPPASSEEGLLKRPRGSSQPSKMGSVSGKPKSRYLLAVGLLAALLYILTRPGVVAPGLPKAGVRGALSSANPAASKEPKTPAMMPIEDAKHYCQTRRWEPYPDRDKKRKVFDLFMINTEVDWLEIRLGELAEQVDYFVVLESKVDFKDRPKPLYVQDNWSRFSKWHHQIIHHVLNVTGVEFKDAWDREHFSRNAMMDQVFPTLSGPSQVNAGDVILVSDVDEIPRADIIKALRNCMFPQRLTLRTDYYRYSFQWVLREEQWKHPQATFYKGADTVKPESLRMDKQDAEIYNAGWHCSSCLASLQDMVNKITSFSHNEFNKPEFTDPKKLLQRVREGRDPYDRETKAYDRIDFNPDVPQYLLKHQEEFAYLLDRDPPSANFKDYKAADFQ